MHGDRTADAVYARSAEMRSRWSAAATATYRHGPCLCRAVACYVFRSSFNQCSLLLITSRTNKFQNPDQLLSHAPKAEFCWLQI